MQDIYKLPKIPTKPIVGIYFLWDKNSLVYIGQSEDINKRISEHRESKNFTHFSYIKCRKKDLLSIEKSYIKTYNPILNKTYAIKSIAENINISDYKLEFNTAIIDKNYFICNINNTIQTIELSKKRKDLFFIGYKGNLKLNTFQYNTYYGEIQFDNKNYFIVYDTKLKIYQLSIK